MEYANFVGKYLRSWNIYWGREIDRLSLTAARTVGYLSPATFTAGKEYFTAIINQLKSPKMGTCFPIISSIIPVTLPAISWPQQGSCIYNTSRQHLSWPHVVNKDDETAKLRPLSA